MNKLEYQKWFNSTPMGRASKLLSNYNRNDKNQERGKGNLTAQWIYHNILFKPCAHCGKTGWDVIGCNRLDNAKPHTKDNVEPCCFECNVALHGAEIKGVSHSNTTLMKRVDQIDKITGEIINSWSCAWECRKKGFAPNHILECCNGKRKTHKGYIWKFPL